MTSLFILALKAQISIISIKLTNMRKKGFPAFVLCIKCCIIFHVYHHSGWFREHLFFLWKASPNLKLFSVCNRASPRIIFNPILTLLNNKNLCFQHICLFSPFMFPFFFSSSPIHPLTFFSPRTKLIAAVYLPAFAGLIGMLPSVCGKWCASVSYTGSVTEWARSTQKAGNPLR